jgi:small subunit ribosomal protein S20
MANTKQATKRYRQNEKRRLRNRVVLGSMRAAVKKARAAIASKAPTTPDLVQTAISQIDKAVSKGALKRQTGSRLVARMASHHAP